MAPGFPPASETQYPGQGLGAARGPARAPRRPSPRPPAVPRPEAKESAAGPPVSGPAALRAIPVRHHPRRWGEPGTRSARPCSRGRRRRRGQRSGRSNGHRGRRGARRTGRRVRGSHGRRSPERRSSGARRRPLGTCRRWRRRGRSSRPGRARSVAPRSPRGSGSAGRGPGPGRARLWGKGVRGAASTGIPEPVRASAPLRPRCLRLTLGPASGSWPGKQAFLLSSPVKSWFESVSPPGRFVWPFFSRLQPYANS